MALPIDFWRIAPRTHYSKKRFGINAILVVRITFTGIASHYGLDNQQKETLFGIPARTPSSLQEA